MRRLPSGRLAASRRLSFSEKLNLRAIRTSEAGFSHKREMKRAYRGSQQEAEHRRRGKS